MPETILIIGSDSRSRDALRALFVPEYAVREASGAAEAVRLLRAERASVTALVLDLASLGSEGYDMICLLKAEEPLNTLPIITVTAAGDEEAQMRALALGAQDAIARPLSPRLTRARVLSLLERRRLESISKENELMRLRLKQQDELLRMAQTDEKSGLDNSQTFCRKVSSLLKSNPRRRYLVVRWDIDRFKVYNDSFGLAEGDRLLRAMGDACRQSGNYLTARLEADHFVCCLPRDEFNGEKVARTAAERLARFSPNYELSLRFGVYEADDPSLDVRLMCDRALLALRSIKGSYTRHVAWYDDKMRKALMGEQDVLSQMENALKDGQFQVYLQPQYDHSNGAMVGAEALVRWIHPQKGVVTPDAFIPLFERSGFISKLDENVWEQTCRMQRHWLDEGLSVVPVSVNISRQDAYNPQLCDTLLALLRKYRLDPSLLRLEITESAYMENPELVIAVTKKLTENGFYVEMDDFGSGYSSLNSLKDMPVSMIKLDMRFIAEGAGSDRGGVILTSVVRMAMWLGISVIAEGVENVKQADYLKTIGCELMQGYLYARPMPSDSFEGLLRACRPGDSDGRFTPTSRFESQEFWNPEAQAAVIFNSFVGAASILEVAGDNVELLRANDDYYALLHIRRGLRREGVSRAFDQAPDEDKSAVLAAVRRAVATDAEAECTVRWRLPDEPGGCLWLRIRFRVIARGRERNALYAAYEDVTDKQRLACELEKQRRSLQALYDALPCAVAEYAQTPGGLYELQSFNDETARLLGYQDREEMRARSGLYPLHIHPDDMALAALQVQDVKRDKPRADFDCRIVRADGETRWVRAHLQRTLIQDGTPLLQCVLTDLTRQGDDGKRPGEDERPAREPSRS